MSQSNIILAGILLLAILLIGFLLYDYDESITHQGSGNTNTPPMPPVSEHNRPQLDDEDDDELLPWDEQIKKTIDPQIQEHHKEFLKDVQIFSSGTGYIDISGDNNTPFFTNFIGLKRPVHVPIGPTARTTVDVDESVLQKNKGFYVI